MIDNCYNIGYQPIRYKPISLIYHEYHTKNVLTKVIERDNKVKQSERLRNRLKTKLKAILEPLYLQLNVNKEEYRHLSLLERYDRLKSRMTPETIGETNKTNVEWEDTEHYIIKPFDETLSIFDSLEKEVVALNNTLVEDVITGDREIRNKAICVGYYPSIIGDILKTIERERRIPAVDSDEYQNLKSFFGDDFAIEWGDLKNYTELVFLPYYIFGHSTIYYVQRILEIIFNVRLSHQYLWTKIKLEDYRDEFLTRLYYSFYDENLGVSQDALTEIFENMGMKTEDISKNIFNKDGRISILNDKLELKKISEDTYKMLVAENSKLEFSLKDFQNYKPLNTFLLDYYLYQNLTFDTIYNKKIKMGQYPFENPYFALVDELILDNVRKYNQLKIKGLIEFTNINQNKTIQSIGNFNEIHWVSLVSINTYLRDNNEDFRTTAQFRKDYIENVLSRFYPKLESQVELEPENLSPYPTKPNEQNMLDDNTNIFNLYLNAKEAIALPASYNFSLNCKNLVETRISLDQISLLNEYNLREIFNKVILDNDLVFARLLDEQRNENVYRLYKPAFGLGGLDKINITQLEKWVNREHQTLNLGKLTKMKEPKKCLTFKLKLCNVQLSNTVKEIKDRILTNGNNFYNCYNVYYKDGLIEENVEEYLITADGQGVYEHSMVYVDFYFYYGQTFVDIKTICDPKSTLNSNFYKLFIHKINQFIINISKIPYLSNLKKIDSYNLLSNNLSICSNVINLSSILEYKYRARIHLNYEYLKRVVAILTPFFNIVEPLFINDDPVEFFYKGRWIQGSINSSQLETSTYKIDYNDGNQLLVANNIKPHLIRNRGEKSKNYYLNFRYKRVSNYEKDTPIIDFLKKNLDWGLSLDEIRDKILKQFDVKSDELEELNKKVGDASEKIKLQGDRKKDVNGVDIKIFLEPLEDELQNKTYTIELNHYRSIEDFMIIGELLELIFRIYYLLYDKKDIDLLEKEFAIDTQQATYEQRQLRTLELEQQQQLEEIEALKLIGYIEDEPDNLEENTQILERAKKEQILNDEILTFDFEMIGSSNNLFLELLYKTDRKQFFWETSDQKQKYTVKCQGTKRYPKVVGPVRYKYIMERYKQGLGLTYIENKDLEGNEKTQVTEEYCEPDKEIGSTNKCVSIRYSSNDEPEQWNNFFMCPKIWCIKCKIPLHPRDLFDASNPAKNCEHFVSQADLTMAEIKKRFNTFKNYEKNEYIIWRKCSVCDEDILEHNILCPECKSAPLEKSNTNLIPTKTTALYVIPAESNYIYPGFIKSDKHPNKIPAVCCFNNANTRLEEKFMISNTRTYYNTLSYIQSYGKELQPGRFGLLPISFSGFLELDTNYFMTTNIRCENNSKNYYYRFGILNSGADNMVSLLSFYLLHNNMDITLDNNVLYQLNDIMINVIVKNITAETLSKFPLIEYSFRGSNISSLQNYIEYLISLDTKADFTLLPLLSAPLNWIPGIEGLEEDVMATGVNIFILSVNDSGKIVIELPRGYLQPYELEKKALSIILFRNKAYNNILEPIVFTKKSCDETTGNDTTGRISKFFEADHPLILKIMEAIKPLKREEPPSALYKNDDNKYLELVDFYNKNLEWFLDNYMDSFVEKNLNITAIVVDNTNLVVGFKLNNLYIPVYPTLFSERYNMYDRIKYVDMLEKNETLDTYVNVAETLLYLIKLDEEELEYLEPIKVIQSTLQNGKVFYTGYYLKCGLITPFRPTEDVSNMYLPVIYLDFYNIERVISNYKEQFKYSELMTIDEFKNGLGGYFSEDNIEYVFNETSDKNLILRGIVLTMVEKGVYSLFVPLVEEIWNSVVPNNAFNGKIPVYDVELTIEHYNKLYNLFDKKLPTRVIGIDMDITTKNIVSVQLETGHYIPVKPVIIYKRYKNDKFKYLLQKIQDMEIDDIFKEDIYKYEKYKTDDRVDYIMSIDYNKSSYERFRFEVARLLSFKNNAEIRNKIQELIKNSRIPLPDKEKKLSNMLYNIVGKNIVYKKLDAKAMDKNYKYMEQTCSVHASKNECSKDPYCNWLDNVNGQSLEEYKTKNYAKVKSAFEQMVKPNSTLAKYKRRTIQFLEENGKAWDEDDLEKNIHNMLEVEYMHSGRCKLVLGNNEGVELYNSFYFRKLVYEILKNTLRSREILENSIQLVDTRLSYNVYPGELFYTEKDLRTNNLELKSIYQRHRRNRIQVSDHFLINSSSYYISIEPIENNVFMEEKLRDLSYNLYQMSKLVDFKIDGVNKLVVDDINLRQRVTILDSDKVIEEVIRLNTPLDTWRVNRISRNVNFKLVAGASA